MIVERNRKQNKYIRDRSNLMTEYLMIFRCFNYLYPNDITEKDIVNIVA